MRPGTLWPFRGLAARVAGTLAIALMPLGAIAVFQAAQIAADEQHRTEAALLTATAEAAAGEALAIASATGAVATLAAQIAANIGPGESCSDLFVGLVRDIPQFSFAGYVDTQGILRCASSDVGRDLSGGLLYPQMSRDRRPAVLAAGFGSTSGASVIVSAAPVMRAGDYLGFVAVSVPHSRIADIPGSATIGRDISIITFNEAGEVLSADGGLPDVAQMLPVGRPLLSLVSTRQYAFHGRTTSGEDRIFAVVPILPGVVHALGSWPRQRLGWAVLSPIVFPVLMLFVGLIVAFGAVNALVIRNIHRLHANLDEFSRTRRILPLSNRHKLALELAEIDQAWSELATKLMQDEAELENLVHEKNVLLKEVHHRVKNNLQLIASIINLKIRRATSPEVQRTLRDVHSRVMNIAAVHRALYSETSRGRVRADDLLRSTIDQTITAGLTEDQDIAISQSFAPVLLYPDQTVPLLLLAAEAVTNALKYMGRLDSGEASLGITLSVEDDRHAQLRVVNTRGTPLLPPEQVAGSGLGRSLIAGFATQLGGRIETLIDDDHYDFRLAFETAGFNPEGRDDDLAEIAPDDDPQV